MATDMTTYLLTWNPERWQWTYLHESIAKVKRRGYCQEPWGSGVTTRIQPNDRVFLMKLGKQKPRGIIASGWATSEVYRDAHWDEAKRAKGMTALYVNVHFDTILDPEKEIFPRERLTFGIYTKMDWEPQASGRTFPDDVAIQLEKDWCQFNDQAVPFREIHFAEEADADKAYREGATKKISVNVFERSAQARSDCIKHYGLSCSVCDFDFAETYGEMGIGFIHVHHLRPLSEVGEGYILNPTKDLRPVCPNCHAMLHQRNPAYTIEELKAIVKRSARQQ
jgi:5-methylcytosine-specific restriction protein A